MPVPIICYYVTDLQIPVVLSSLIIYNEIMTEGKFDINDLQNGSGQVKNGTTDNADAIQGSLLPAVNANTTFISGRIDVMKLAHGKLHLNQYNLPTLIYRPDFLPGTVDPENTDQIADDNSWDNAAVYISYAEGFPTIEGNPIWERLEFESLEAYTAFQFYQELKNTSEGMRGLFQMEQHEDCKLNRGELNDMFYSFYWPQRALAYDTFNSMVRDRRREHRALSMNDILFDRAKDLTDIALKYMKDDEFVELMTPKVSMDLFGMGVRHQRMALGMDPSGKPAIQQKTKSIEVSAGVLATQTGDGMKVDGAIETERHMRDAILNDPDMTALAQKLVIKITEAAE